MNTTEYLDIFQKAADRLDKKKLNKKRLEFAVCLYKTSVCLKLYKEAWANPGTDALTAPTRIFFSVWINEEWPKEQKIRYNIHALKLRYLKGYTIASREFAETFRSRFNAFAHEWPNVNVQFGPLTLMEGWQNANEQTLQNEIVELSNRFLQIEHLIDENLARFEKKIS
jgi:hypothetical protein